MILVRGPFRSYTDISVEILGYMHLYCTRVPHITAENSKSTTHCQHVSFTESNNFHPAAHEGVVDRDPPCPRLASYEMHTI